MKPQVILERLKVKNYITRVDQKFPGKSTASIQMLQVIKACTPDINALASRFIMDLCI